MGIRLRYVIFAGCAVLFSAGASAATISKSTTVTVQAAPLAMVFAPAAPTIACGTAPGTVVLAISTTGGDTNPITYSLSGDTADFALSGTNVVVGPNGVAAANCGKGLVITITATQP